MCMPISLYLYPSIYHYIYPSMYLSIYASIYLSMRDLQGALEIADLIARCVDQEITVGPPRTQTCARAHAVGLFPVGSRPRSL